MIAILSPKPTKHSDKRRTKSRARNKPQTDDSKFSEELNPKIKSSTHQGITIRRGAPPPPGDGARAAGGTPC
jgi:hypothetical protein